MVAQADQAVAVRGAREASQGKRVLSFAWPRRMAQQMTPIWAMSGLWVGLQGPRRLCSTEGLAALAQQLRR